MTIDRSIYLGSTTDPQPVFRDNAPDTSAWPAAAAFAVTFTPERFPTVQMMRPRELGVAYFDIDGWPPDMPASRRAELPVAAKRELQTYPKNWRRLSERNVEILREDPDFFIRLRMMAGVVHSLSPTLPPPEPSRVR